MSLYFTAGVRKRQRLPARIEVGQQIIMLFETRHLLADERRFGQFTSVSVDDAEGRHASDGLLWGGSGPTGKEKRTPGGGTICELPRGLNGE